MNKPDECHEIPQILISLMWGRDEPVVAVGGSSKGVGRKNLGVQSQGEAEERQRARLLVPGMFQEAPAYFGLVHA